MSVALRLYEQLTEAPDERTKARLIAEAFEQLEERYPQLKGVATQSQVRETELRLQKEIKEVEARLAREIKEVEVRLVTEINKLAVEIKSVDASLRLEIRSVEVKIAETRADLIRWVVAVGILQTTLLTGVLLKIAHLI
ncbi:hypothetical protein RP726_02860 [Candidatus Methylospira mobilis]|uniref:hypothetical protein n=1 Tax=Candidatus Methylospira mobilis TaxID=1808979 RepID=UPI0028E740D1|nr:hypothetical protein [Candidatus Methylospira mobilis]WNV05362.1 hypothetical protein RP726_02860 [Candidatus Methylospira mobilis]